MADENEKTQPKEGEDSKENLKSDSSDSSSGESPLQVAERLNAETKEMLSQISQEREKIEKTAADLAMTGRSFAGQQPREPTEDEKYEKSVEERYGGLGISPIPKKGTF